MGVESSLGGRKRGKDGIQFQLKTCFKISKRENTEQTNQPKS